MNTMQEFSTSVTSPDARGLQSRLEGMRLRFEYGLRCQTAVSVYLDDGLWHVYFEEENMLLRRTILEDDGWFFVCDERRTPMDLGFDTIEEAVRCLLGATINVYGGSRITSL